MRAFYINLADAAERRAALEAGFAARKSPGWELARVEAATAAEAAALPGRASPREKACFLSHLRAVEASLSVDGPSWILEDDVAFGPNSFPLIDGFVADRAEAGWDILLADFCIGHLGQILRFMDMGRDLFPARRAVTLDLRPVLFSGAMSYVVAASAKRAILDLHAGGDAIDLPYDVFLRQAVRSGNLRAAGVFPFATTLQPQAERSQVGGENSVETDFLLRSLSRALWFDRDLSALLPGLETRIRDHPEARVYGAILGALLFARRK
jgi:hypothetical protein